MLRLSNLRKKSGAVCGNSLACVSGSTLLSTARTSWQQKLSCSPPPPPSYGVHQLLRTVIWKCISQTRI
ncbi:hypothetical protein V6N13_047010 [Hibiscus sabdariffa]